MLDPLEDFAPDPQVAALPKVDLHIHQEVIPRLDLVLAKRESRPPQDWKAWAARLMTEAPPGMPRLKQLGAVIPVAAALDADDDLFSARVEHLLLESARDGAVLCEVRCGNDTLLRPDFMTLFREAEQRIRQQYPRFHAEVIVTLLLWQEPERLERIVSACIQMADTGIRGIDLLYQPYDTEADWSTAYRIGERAADAGLGITVHAGEFSTANLAAAMRVPGLTRIGHATQAVREPRLLAQLAEHGITVECCLSCNVVLGAVSSYEQHPIRALLDAGIPVTLGTDDPVQINTTIGREYAIARKMGFTLDELRVMTRNGVRAAFTTPERRASLLKLIEDYPPDNRSPE